ncbi:MAG TPA: hypothetical protein VH765_05290 [Xanthobacteraceae bacterium]|jgi:hypothetical protein
MSDQLEIRARMDTETARALLVANGGGAVAMLAVLPPVLDREGFEPLAQAILIGLLLMMFGVVLAIIHNDLRRRCSLVHQLHNMDPPKGKILGIDLWAPTVCCASVVCMWLSTATFVGAGTYVAVSGISTVSDVQKQKSSSRPGGAAEPKGGKAKAR